MSDLESLRKKIAEEEARLARMFERSDVASGKGGSNSLRVARHRNTQRESGLTPVLVIFLGDENPSRGGFRVKEILIKVDFYLYCARETFH